MNAALWAIFFLSFLGFYFSFNYIGVGAFIFFYLIKKNPEHECFVRSPRVLMYTCIHVYMYIVQTVEVSKSRIYYLISLSFAVTQFSLHILVTINEMQSKWQWQWHSILFYIKRANRNFFNNLLYQMTDILLFIYNLLVCDGCSVYAYASCTQEVPWPFVHIWT